MVAFYNNRDEEEHAAFIHGDVCNAENVPLRVHSECRTDDAIGSFGTSLGAGGGVCRGAIWACGHA